MYCQDCGAELDPGATACTDCGATNDAGSTGPLLPAVLSFLLPGLGQLFLGRAERAAAVFVAALFGAYVLLGAGGFTLALLAPVVAAYDAYRLAADADDGSTAREADAPSGSEDATIGTTDATNDTDCTTKADEKSAA